VNKTYLWKRQSKKQAKDGRETKRTPAGAVGASMDCHYTMHGKQGVFGMVSKKRFLKIIMDSCLDFKQEDTLLQSME